MSEILIGVEPEPVAVVTLHRPARRNAVSLAAWRELELVLRRLSETRTYG